MIVKSSKEYHYMSIGMLFVLFVMTLMLLPTSKDSFSRLLVALIFLVPSLIVVRYWITVGRTIAFTEYGIKVEFFFLKCFYRWSDIRLKKIEYFGGRFDSKDPYISGAVFSAKQAKWSNHLKPEAYGYLIHPFSFVFVHFDPHIQYRKWDYKFPDVYVVDETEFRKKMKEWNVFS